MNVVVLINGTVTVSKNYAEYHVVQFGFSNITFTKTAKFLSNICFNVIHLKSLDLPYMKILDYTNITFTNNICSDEVISIQAAAYDVFPPCFYQYMYGINKYYRGNPFDYIPLALTTTSHIKMLILIMTHFCTILPTASGYLKQCLMVMIPGM